MKLQVLGNKVVAYAETAEDSVALLGLGKVRVHKPHKKHRYKQACPVCNKPFKSLRMHKTLTGHTEL